MTAAHVLACLALFMLAFVVRGHTQPMLSEDIEIGLSTDTVSITSDFSGANLTIFGALDNVDPLISSQGGYDIVVILEGPRQTLTVRKKTRVLGMWINTQSMIFRDVPASYSVAMTRPPQDITEISSYETLALRPRDVRLRPLDPSETSARIQEFSTALRARKEASGLYVERVGGVEFLSRSLFRATLRLAPNVPVGTHRARAFLFRKGVFVQDTSAPLSIRKAGFEQRVFAFAYQQSFIYGVLSALLAVVTGWAGRMIFRKD
ncbi:TIGR02186 family protein [Chelativorans sp. YIM 93263]|uniref:TIGR02186 family protein n=1 Tax=Chelativorans sp. YIM 93263 TaxID=2906648 RepID=UPI0023783D3A|nr:TIGR02186 family protein [Chelativorans sp. YIM 93263]